MIRIENPEAFAGVIAEALKSIDTNTGINTFEKLRWVNAVAKATARIEQSGSFMTWQPEKDSLLIWSDSNEIYETGALCQCLAHTNGQPCWHKAAYGLIRNYEVALGQIERDQIERRREMLTAPYLKNTDRPTAEIVGGVAI